ncbi:MAG: PEP-CTERM system histidine kinase PrsK [Gammaproteobacteria bacterium]
MLHLFENVGTLGYALNALAYLVLSILLLVSWKKRLLGGLLLVAVIYEVLWSVVLAYHSATLQLPDLAVEITENFRLIIWVAFLLEVLRSAANAITNKRIFLFSYAAIFTLFVISIGVEVFGRINDIDAPHIFTYLYDLLLVTFGLILTEQLYRNTAQDKRWSIKFLCIGIGLMFAYDLYMYSHATLFEGIDRSLWNARGYVNMVIMPLLAVSIARNPTWSFRMFVSRQVVFYSTGLIAIGIYMTLMAIGGYYVQIFGGEWGQEAQVVFLVGAIIILFVIMSSGALRAKARMFMSKHFYENKYDYREEWMGFVQKLSHIDSPRYLKEQILQTVAMIMHSRGSILYLRNEEKYQCVSAWNTDYCEQSFDVNSSLAEFLNNREWIIDVNEFRHSPENYDGLDLPEEFYAINAWLIVPLKHYYELIGFIILLEPFVKMQINWEDRDLLKAIGKQVSSYVAFMMASDSLAEAEKFSAFNRLSAYVVHDMKNSVAQLELLKMQAGIKIIRSLLLIRL